jgi:hypothetical protein
MNEIEIWKNYNESYSCSNLGRFKNIKTERILKTWRTGHKDYSYLKIGLGANRHRRRAHIVVAELFCVKPISIYDKLEVDHINHNRHDNRACNLQWITHQENCLKKKIHIINI